MKEKMQKIGRISAVLGSPVKPTPKSPLTAKMRQLRIQVETLQDAENDESKLYFILLSNNP